MGFFDSLFGGSKKKSNDLSSPEYQCKLASKIASLFDGFILQAGADAFLGPTTAVVLSRGGDVFISQADRSKLSAMQPIGYTQISQLPTYRDVYDTMSSDPESAMLTMFMDNLARETLGHLLRQLK